MLWALAEVEAEAAETAKVAQALVALVVLVEHQALAVGVLLAVTVVLAQAAVTVDLAVLAVQAVVAEVNTVAQPLAVLVAQTEQAVLQVEQVLEQVLEHQLTTLHILYLVHQVQVQLAQVEQGEPLSPLELLEDSMLAAAEVRRVKTMEEIQLDLEGLPVMALEVAQVAVQVVLHTLLQQVAAAEGADLGVSERQP
jgi:hypothetical protein